MCARQWASAHWANSNHLCTLGSGPMLMTSPPFVLECVQYCSFLQLENCLREDVSQRRAFGQSHTVALGIEQASHSLELTIFANPEII